MTLVTVRSKWLLQQIKFYDGNDFKTIRPGSVILKPMEIENKFKEKIGKIKFKF